MLPAPVLWICGCVAAAVFAVMIHSIATFRRARPGPGAPRSALAEFDLVEILWASVPIFIMVGSALPAVRMLASQHAVSTVQAHNDP